MKAVKRQTERSESPHRHIKTTDKSSNRARTVTLAHAQDRQNARSRGGLVATSIKRPVIQPDSSAAIKSHKTPLIEL